MLICSTRHRPDNPRNHQSQVAATATAAAVSAPKVVVQTPRSVATSVKKFEQRPVEPAAERALEPAFDRKLVAEARPIVQADPEVRSDEVEAVERAEEAAVDTSAAPECSPPLLPPATAPDTSPSNASGIKGKAATWGMERSARDLGSLPKPAGRKGPPAPSAASLCPIPVDIRTKLSPRWVRPIAFGQQVKAGPVEVSAAMAVAPAELPGEAATETTALGMPAIEAAAVGTAPVARTARTVSVRTGGSSRRFVSVRLPSRLVRAFLSRPPTTRLLFLAAAGVFALAGAVIVARNKLEAASRPPIARVMNPTLAEQRLKLTRSRADLIHRVVGMYAAQHGSPPEKLEALVPEFLPGIPQPLNGATEWTYRVDADGRRWSIGFRSWSAMRPELREERIDASGVWAMVDGE